MLVENSYPGDVRVKNEAEKLVSAGYSVTVIGLRHAGQKFSDEVNGVRVFRVPPITIFKKLGKSGSSWLRFIGFFQALIGYVVEYVYFTAACLAVSIYVALRWGFDVVHAHNPPDTLCVIGGFYKVFGKDFVFDHHDLSPELYLSRFGLRTGQRGAAYRTLLAFEKISLRLSTVSIATNESYKAIQIERGGMQPDQVFVVRNGPYLDRIRLVEPDKRLRSMKKSILGYVGVMNPQDGVDYMLRSLHVLVHELKRTDFYCVAVGSGDSIDDLKRLSEELELGDYVWFTGIISEEDLRRSLSSMDICLDPNPSSPLNDVSTWIKVMEYMAMGKPIVAYDLKETRYSAQEAAVYVPPNDEVKFAEAIVELMDQPDRRTEWGSFDGAEWRRSLSGTSFPQNCWMLTAQGARPRAFFMTLWRPCSRNDGRSCGIRWG